MITFITTIRHPDNSNDYNRVWNILRNTLRSICSQTNNDYKVIVVTNKILDDFKSDSKIKNLEFVEVDFDAPTTDLSLRARDRTPVRLDKSTKYIRGLIYAKKYNSKYTMFFDSDDFISNKLVDYISTNDKDQNGWIIKSGYVTNLKKIITRFDELSFCGSNIIFNTKLLESEIDFSILHNESTQLEIKKSTSDFYLLMVVGSHRFSIKYFRKKGFPFATIPFPGTTYYVGTGENCAQHNQEKVYFGKGAGGDITDKIRKEFNLPS